jgi:hypothetical protein
MRVLIEPSPGYHSTYIICTPHHLADALLLVLFEQVPLLWAGLPKLSWMDLRDNPK